MTLPAVPTPRVPQMGRIPQLDILRAVAALSVVWVHYWSYPRDNLAVLVPWLAELLSAGDRLLQVFWPRGWSHPGVILFIVLSGFCIHLPQAGRPERPGDTRAFFRRRFFRIYPVFLAALGLGFFANLGVPPQSNIWVIPEPWSVGGLLASLAGLTAFWPGPGPVGNTILHTVIAEMGLYVLYPVGLALVRRKGWPVVLSATAGISLVAVAWTHYGRVEWAFTSTWGFLFFWWLGAFAAEFRALGRRLSAPRFWLYGAALVVLYAGFNTWVRYPAMSLFVGPLVAELWGLKFEGSALLAGPCFAALCMGLVWHIDYVRVGSAWIWRALEWIGERSYSLYVVHIPTLGLTLWLLRGTEPWPTLFWLTVPLLAVAVVALGMYQWVEAPGMRRGRTIKPTVTPGNAPAP